MAKTHGLAARVAPAVVVAATGRHYAAPPIQEALAEVYFHGSQWDLTIPGLFYPRVSTAYPTIEQQTGLQIGIEVGLQGPSATHSVVPDRARFRSLDGSRMVQIGQDLLVFNRLRPYECFREWHEAFSEMLTIYRELARPVGFTRVGVRYLNKIAIPEEAFDLKKYFHLYPQVPKQMGSPFGPFLLRVQAHPPTHASHTLMTTFGTTETDDGKPALLLDLYDVIEGGENADLAIVDRLVLEGHENISGAFENALTDEARALFREASP